MTRANRDRVILVASLLAGAALQLWQYFGRASFWLDEVAIAFNVFDRPLSAQIGQPLAYDQVGPAGFLVAAKIATWILPNAEFALRLFPLLCALASLPLFALVAKRLVSSQAALIATVFYALGIPFIRYAAEAKPYSGDVAAALILTWIADRLLAAEPRQAQGLATAAGLAGIGAVVFSSAAALVIAGLAAALLVEASLRRDRRLLGPLAVTLSLWTAAVGVAFAWGRHVTTEATRVFLRHFWKPGFPLITWRHRFGARFLLGAVGDFWGGQMGYRPPLVFAAASILGLVALTLRRRASALLLIGPIVAAFGASVLEQYPFRGRLILFLGPALILGAATTASGIVGLGARLRIPRLASAAALCLPAVLAVALHPPVYSREEPRPLIQELVRRRRATDPVYVFYGTSPAMRFYGPRLGLGPSGVFLGECHRGHLAAYLEELDRFRGAPRLWVIIVHHQTPLGEQAAIRGYLDRIGRRLETEGLPEEGGQSTLDLYDLSDGARLASTNAATFPLPPFDAGIAERLGCGHGPR